VRRRAFDEVVRTWALTRARDDAIVYTSDLATRFNLTTESAVKRLQGLRDRGYLAACEVKEHYRLGNEITELGLAYLAREIEPPVTRRWDCMALCVALREGMLL
jgi:hypothetical protein